jgi:hypothetical protein
VRKVRFIGNAERVFPQLPFWVQVEASARLKVIAAAKDEHVPGTLSVVNETRLRHFSVGGLLFTYLAPRTADRTLWVLRIARKR